MGLWALISMLGTYVVKPTDKGEFTLASLAGVSPLS
jgi:hypothetical protein